ncbi:hypothetical protein GQ53DRAFT_835329 [Thozetella sp. PMI_491]|nr:hypothetical protein GQ53DRAFT_835329 [Thozetella sp. PMI_491]
MYYVMSVTAGHAIPTNDIFEIEKEWLRASLATDICFYTCLAAAKLSCLFFFRRLGHHIESQRYLRWPALIVTLGVWVVSIARVPYNCLVGSIDDINIRCAEPSAIHSAAVTVKVNCALDVFSDFLILLIPITLLWNVRMPLVRKSAFIGLFSLSVVTMVVAIFRAGGMDRTRLEDRQADPTFLWLWGAVESSVAVVIVCISAFPQLFVQSKPTYKPTDSYIQRLKKGMHYRQQNPPTLYDLLSIIPKNTSDLSDIHRSRSAHHEYSCDALLPGAPKSVVFHYKSTFSEFHAQGDINTPGKADRRMAV